VTAVVSAPLHKVEAVAALRFAALSNRRLQVLMDRNNNGSIGPEQNDEMGSFAQLSEMISLMRLRFSDAGHD
jgi:hypothetical protein